MLALWSFVAIPPNINIAVIIVIKTAIAMSTSNTSAVVTKLVLARAFRIAVADLINTLFELNERHSLLDINVRCVAFEDRGLRRFDATGGNDGFIRATSGNAAFTGAISGNDGFAGHAFFEQTARREALEMPLDPRELRHREVDPLGGTLELVRKQDHLINLLKKHVDGLFLGVKYSRSCCAVRRRPSVR